MNSRIREVRKALGFTQREFAQKIGLQHNAVSIMEKPNTKILEYYLLAICFRDGVNETWLRTGVGEMFAEKDPKKREILSLFQELTPPFQDRLLSDAAGLLKLQTQLSETKEES